MEPLLIEENKQHNTDQEGDQEEEIEVTYKNTEGGIL